MKLEKVISRRRFLEAPSALGGLVVCGGFNPLFAQEERARTEDQVLGPFYPITRPLDRDAVLQGVFMRLGTEWEGFSAVPDEFIDGGDAVVVLGKYSGKYKATGKSFRAGFAHVWKIQAREGRQVRAVRGHTDRSQGVTAIDRGRLIRDDGPESGGGNSGPAIKLQRTR